MRTPAALKVVVPIGAAASVAALCRSIVRQRRNPQPFPAARARALDNPLARRQAAAVVRGLDLAPRMRVLDVGAGVGRLSIPLAAAVAPEGDVVALDVQQEMLDMLQKRAGAADVHNIRTICAAAGAGSLGPGRFDRAVLAAVLGEIPHDRRVAALREIREALEPDGILWVIETVGDPHYQSHTAVARLGKEAGFNVRGTRRLGMTRLTELVVGA